MHDDEGKKKLIDSSIERDSPETGLWSIHSLIAPYFLILYYLSTFG